MIIDLHATVYLILSEICRIFIAKKILEKILTGKGWT